MKFSIITCTYNSAKYLQKNIDSVRSQTHQDFEHIFIDGFSADGTVDIIKEYQKEFPDRVQLFQIAPKGISNAMNEGIRKSSGDYLIHLHSDDSFLNGRVLEDVDMFLAGKNYDWIYGKINVVEENFTSIGTFPDKKIFQNNNKNIFGNYLLKFYNYIPHQSVFIKKSVFETFGYFDETLTSAMDPDMWFRIRNKTNWVFYDRVISNYRIRNGSQSASMKNRSENAENQILVQKRYLNSFEFFFARIINSAVDLRNKNYR